MGDGRHLNAASTIVAKAMRIIMAIGEFKNRVSRINLSFESRDSVFFVRHASYFCMAYNHAVGWITSKGYGLQSFFHDRVMGNKEKLILGNFFCCFLSNQSKARQKPIKSEGGSHEDIFIPVCDCILGRHCISGNHRRCRRGQCCHR